MKQLVLLLLSGMFAAAPFSCGAQKAGLRILPRSAAAVKSCSEIAGFIADAAPERFATVPDRRPEKLNCGTAQRIPWDAKLALVKTTWNAAAERWEFALRCIRPEQCVPFLVWKRETENPGKKSAGASLPSPAKALAGESSGLKPGLIKPGQTATLIWDEAGIRIVIPVTCLDAGGPGDSVRIKFKNGPGILRAEVLNDGSLRASL